MDVPALYIRMNHLVDQHRCSMQIFASLIFILSGQQICVLLSQRSSQKKKFLLRFFSELIYEWRLLL